MQREHKNLWFVSFLVRGLLQSAVYLYKPPRFAMNSRVVVDETWGNACTYMYGLPYSLH